MTRFEKKIEKALKVLRSFEPKDGYYVAFSGGKDSCVIYDLVKKSGVKYDVNHSITTIDPPEMMKWMKKTYPEVIRHKPELSMFELVAKKKSVPTRINRFCCEYLKENGGEDRVVVLGIRAEESSGRANRELIEYYGKKNKLNFNIILDWTEKDVWQYIDDNNIPYCPLYDGDYSRLGCVGCPAAGAKRMKIEFAEYPHIKKGYLKAIKKGIEQGGFKRFVEQGLNENNIFDWWVSNLPVKDYLQTLKQEELGFEGTNPKGDV